MYYGSKNLTTYTTVSNITNCQTNNYCSSNKISSK